MTDGRTDGQTEISSLYRVCITCSAVKKTIQSVRTSDQSVHRQLSHQHWQLFTPLCSCLVDNMPLQTGPCSNQTPLQISMEYRQCGRPVPSSHPRSCSPDSCCDCLIATGLKQRTAVLRGPEVSQCSKRDALAHTLVSFSKFC